MSGTQDMIARILADAEAEGARIEEQARNKAGVLLQEAGEQAEESKRRAAEEAAKQAEDIVRSARSAAELIRRNILLEKRRGLCADALDGTIRARAALPAETYLPLLLRSAMSAPGNQPCSPVRTWSSCWAYPMWPSFCPPCGTGDSAVPCRRAGTPVWKTSSGRKPGICGGI